MLFPVIGAAGGAKVDVNFGKSPFVYKIKEHDWDSKEGVGTIANLFQRADLHANAADIPELATSP